MRTTILVAAVGSAAAIWLLGPAVAAVAGVVGLLGALLHEILHYVVAVAVGAENVAVGWDATGPYVAYDGRMQPLVQLAPALTAVALTVWLTATTGFPNASTQSVLAASFLTGLHSLSPTDYAPLQRALTTSV